LTDVEIVYSDQAQEAESFLVIWFLWKSLENGNENTTVSFSDDVIIDGKTLKKGKYSLYTNPK
jgi:hypothetical protein